MRKSDSIQHLTHEIEFHGWKSWENNILTTSLANVRAFIKQFEIPEDQYVIKEIDPPLLRGDEKEMQDAGFFIHHVPQGLFVTYPPILKDEAFKDALPSEQARDVLCQMTKSLRYLCKLTDSINPSKKAREFTP